MSTPQNSQIHSNNSSAVVDHLVGLVLKELKQSVHIYLPLNNSINRFLYKNKFSDELKQSEVIILYKKINPLKERTTGP